MTTPDDLAFALAMWTNSERNRLILAGYNLQAAKALAAGIVADEMQRRREREAKYAHASA